MKKENNNFKNRLIYFFVYIIVIIMIYDCNSIYSAGIHSYVLNKLTLYLMIFSVGILLIVNYNSTIPMSRYIMSMSMLSIYLVVYLILQKNQRAINFGISYLVKFLLMYSLAFFICHNNKVDVFIKIYVQLIFLIAVVSLFFWLSGSTLHLVQPNRSYLSMWTGTYENVPSYFNVYFETQSLNLTVRNSAIFTEAPMASLAFSIALILEILYQKNEKFYFSKAVILTIAVISTLSSTGYIFLIVLFGYIILMHKNNNYLDSIKLVLVPVVAIILLILVKKVLYNKLITSSGLIRSRDFFNSFKAWVKYPILGLGINMGQNPKEIMDWNIGNFGYSTSMGKILGENGLYIFILYLSSIIKSVYTGIKYKSIKRIFVTFMIFYLFITTLFVNTYLLFFIMSVLFIAIPRLIKR